MVTSLWAYNFFSNYKEKGLVITYSQSDLFLNSLITYSASTTESVSFSTYSNTNTDAHNVSQLLVEKKGKFLNSTANFSFQNENNMLNGAAVLTFTNLNNVSQAQSIPKNLSANDMKSLVDWAEIIKNLEPNTTPQPSTIKISQQNTSAENDVLDQKLSTKNKLKQSETFIKSVNSTELIVDSLDNSLDAFTSAMAKQKADKKLSTISMRTPLLTKLTTDRTEIISNVYNNLEMTTKEIKLDTITDLTTGEPIENTYTTTSTDFPSTTFSLPQNEITTEPTSTSIPSKYTEASTFFDETSTLSANFEPTNIPSTVLLPTTTTEYLSQKTLPLPTIKSKTIESNLTDQYYSEIVPQVLSSSTESTSGGFNDSGTSHEESEMEETDIKTIVVASLSVVAVLALILLIGFLVIDSEFCKFFF